jgi:hypothetical protein
MAILTPVPQNFQQKIRSEMVEGLRLSYADIIPTIIQMRVTLAGTEGPNPLDPRAGATLPGPATDTYRVPGDYNFLVTEIHAHLAMMSLSTENTTGAATTGLTALSGVQNRSAVKALNAFATLVNADRNDLTFVETNIINSSSNGAVQSPLCLGTLLPGCGGAPIKMVDQNYVAPLIVPANERLRLTVVLRDAGASLGQTEYGLTLIGALVRMRVG